MHSCAARGYFASKSKRLRDDLLNVFEETVDHLAESQGNFPTRRDVIFAVKEVQAARS